jgi:hypothetical protein
VGVPLSKYLKCQLLQKISQLRITMNTPSFNSSSTSDLPRCQHHTRTGRRCRHAVSNATTGLCSKHSASRPIRLEGSDLTAYLTDGLSDLTSAVPLNKFLSRLLQLQVEGRIHPRRAAVMAYSCNLILRTLPAIEHELHPEDEPVTIDFGNLPRPPGCQGFQMHAPPSHPDMSWRTPSSDIPNPQESS